MEEETHLEAPTTDTVLTDKVDLCQQLLDRYGKSSAPQHRHLCATAAATRSIILSESLPLSPLSYFAATIDAISDTSKALDSNAVSALSSFLAMVLPLVPEKSISPEKAAEAVGVIVELLEMPNEAVTTASVRAMVKCLGVLIAFCDLEDWASIKLGFETLLKFSIDKRPKVRKCSQECVVKIFKSLESSSVTKKASEMVYSFLINHMPLALKLSVIRAEDGTKVDTSSAHEYLEIIHFLGVLKHIYPSLSIKGSSKVLRELQKLINSWFSPLTRHLFDIVEVTLESSRSESIISEMNDIIKSLALYVQFRENPDDTILLGATLLRKALDNFHVGEGNKWTDHHSLVVGSLAGLLTSEGSTASQASKILKELISSHIDGGEVLIIEDQPTDGEAAWTIKSTCAVFDNVLNSSGGIPNEHVLAVISFLFLKLGGSSHFYMRNIVVKLADLMTVAARGTHDTKYLQDCIGSAVVAMGPEKILSLIPIFFNAEDLTCSNIWLVPILREYIVGSSLQFFMEHFVPLAESFQQSCNRVKKSVIRRDLQAHAHSCWGLLAAFCCFPTDTYENFGSLAKLLIPFLKKDSSILEEVSVALQELVNQNRSVLRSKEGVGECAKLPKMVEVIFSSIDFRTKPSYSRKIANRNIRALSSCSEDLLQALTSVLFESAPEKRAYVKDAIRCLTSITDSLVLKTFFISSIRKFEIYDDFGESEKLETDTKVSVDKEQSDSTCIGKDAERCLILELAAAIVEGASEDLIDLIFNLIRHTLQKTDGIAHCEAYHALSRILEEHSSFLSLQFDQTMDLLLGQGPPSDVTTLRSRFACFKTMLVHIVKRSLDEENTKAFLILNELILTLKDSTEEGRKAAHDALLAISSSLRDLIATSDDGPYQKLISMILGYLSGSSPHIKSGAVSALSILVYTDADACLLMPDLVPSVVSLLKTKAVEVIKAVLGFLKVLASTIQTKDLQTFLPSIVDGVLPWSFSSRNHFKSKVTVILEILMRKCGSAAVKLHTPERYKDFVKSVLENRRGMSSSTEATTNQGEQKLSESSQKGQQKRKRKEDESGEPKKRKRENRPLHRDSNTNKPRISSGGGNKFARRTEEDGHFRGEKPSFGRSQGQRKKAGFDRKFSGGKRKMEKQNEPNGHRRVGKKQQKPKK